MISILFSKPLSPSHRLLTLTGAEVSKFCGKGVNIKQFLYMKITIMVKGIQQGEVDNDDIR